MLPSNYCSSIKKENTQFDEESVEFKGLPSLSDLMKENSPQLEKMLADIAKSQSSQESQKEIIRFEETIPTLCELIERNMAIALNLGLVSFH